MSLSSVILVFSLDSEFFCLRILVWLPFLINLLALRSSPGFLSQPSIWHSKHRGSYENFFWKVALIPYILEVVQCSGVIESDGLYSMGTLLDTSFWYWATLRPRISLSFFLGMDLTRHWKDSLNSHPCCYDNITQLLQSLFIYFFDCAYILLDWGVEVIGVTEPIVRFMEIACDHVCDHEWTVAKKSMHMVSKNTQQLDLAFYHCSLSIETLKPASTLNSFDEILSWKCKLLSMCFKVHGFINDAIILSVNLWKRRCHARVYYVFSL